MDSSTFRDYREAFFTATGLPMVLVGTDLHGGCFPDHALHHNRFCEVLHQCQSACAACIETNRRLLQRASAEGLASCQCFAGLTASAIPVKVGTSVVAYLKTGQVLCQPANPEQFEAALRTVGKKTLGKATIQLLRKTYFESCTLEPQRYASMIVLLQSFAEQLSRHAESLAVIDEGREPCSIAKARRYVHLHLGDPLSLGEVAHVAGLSDSHFCRLFREITSITLTEYVNRSRIEWAKRELLRQERRVSEIAYEVGYQSLSQFNRTFLRIAGMPPSAWRHEQIAGVSADFSGIENTPPFRRESVKSESVAGVPFGGYQATGI